MTDLPPVDATEPSDDPVELFLAWQRRARGELPPGAPLLRRAQALLDRLARRATVWLLRSPDLPSAQTACLCTADAAGEPAGRMVIVREASDAGFVFYTDARSPKAAELAARPHAELVFLFAGLLRQVRVAGAVERIERAREERSWSRCPRQFQLATRAATHQSAVLEDRAELEARLDATRREYRGRDISCPDYWAGYRVLPERLEFWEGRPDRLHLRWLFTREASGWRRRGLEP